MIRFISLGVLSSMLLLQSVAYANSFPILSEETATLSQKESEAVRLSHEWLNRRSMPARGDNGQVIFNFGATLPTIVCAPLQICDLELQPGERVRDLMLGDTVRWKVLPAKSGSIRGDITHLVIKPSDVGIKTTMVVTTDRRTYNIQLVSRLNDWMPRIAFAYFEDIEVAWESYKKGTTENMMLNNIPDGSNAENLDFDYKVTSKKKGLLPVRVYNDGIKTYIQMPAKMQQTEAPALLVLGPDKIEQMVNYRLRNDTYIVDQIFDEAFLISGVGRKQQRVIIKKSSGTVQDANKNQKKAARAGAW